MARIRMRRRRRLQGLGWTLRLALLPGLLLLSFGCPAVESPEELQALAGEIPPERQEPVASPPPAADDDLNAFPVGSVFPGLGGRLHSSLCDPASDPYGTCL